MIQLDANGIGFVDTWVLVTRNGKTSGVTYDSRAAARAVARDMPRDAMMRPARVRIIYCVRGGK
jgi:hypothetical protein